MIAEGDKVVLYAVMHGTHSGLFMGVVATNKSLAIRNIDIYQIADGKIANIIRLSDGLEALKQMGVSIKSAGKEIT